MYMYIHIGYIRRDEGRTGPSKVCVYVCERGVCRERERERCIYLHVYIYADKETENLGLQNF